MHYPRKSQRKCTKKSRTYPPTVTVFFHALCDCPTESRLYRRTQPRSRGSEAGLRMPYLVGNKEVS